MRLVFTVADAAHTNGLVALFEASGSPCFCRYWHFADTNNAWLERCASAPDENRTAFAAALQAQSDEARGLVAVFEGTVVGWLKVAPATVMAKAYERRFYKSLSVLREARDGVFLVGCALVHPAYRKRGVARGLVGAAVQLAPAWGARVLEALPRVPNDEVEDEDLWTGPLGAFSAHGFEVVASGDFEQYPVLRRTLDAVNARA